MLSSKPTGNRGDEPGRDTLAVLGYEANPVHPAVGGGVDAGWARPVSDLPQDSCTVALDGPTAVAWDRVVGELAARLRADGRQVLTRDVRDDWVPWTEFVVRTGGGDLAADPDFARLATVDASALFDADPDVPDPPPGGVAVLYGPGAALAVHDVLWYADLPKRFAEAALGTPDARNLGAGRSGPPATSRRLFYIDWPVLDRHRDSLLPGLDRWFDTQGSEVTSIRGDVLRASARSLTGRPFRTRPVFNTTPWGGHWAQRRLGMNPSAKNTALGYELIAPESGVLLGDEDGPRTEIPFAAVVALEPVRLLGARVHEAFGPSFPIRFDYLDTSGGGNLSVHCHPQADYMHQVFGWPYTQHETYYVVHTEPGRKVYLGLLADTDVSEFHERAHRADADGVPFDVEDFVQTFPAELHRLFLVPAGTPHGSGAGNVVLEVSATPYLYSLRFYDWLRHGSNGAQRPVHVEHAFANLDGGRRGNAVTRELVQPPRTIRDGDGWREELLGALPEMFYEVRRIRLDGGSAPCQTGGGFEVLTVVDGAGVVIDWAGGCRELAYAETIVLPAALDRYDVTAVDGPAMVVTARVSPPSSR